MEDQIARFEEDIRASTASLWSRVESSMASKQIQARGRAALKPIAARLHTLSKLCGVIDHEVKEAFIMLLGFIGCQLHITWNIPQSLSVRFGTVDYWIVWAEQNGI